MPQRVHAHRDERRDTRNTRKHPQTACDMRRCLRVSGLQPIKKHPQHPQLIYKCGCLRVFLDHSLDKHPHLYQQVRRQVRVSAGVCGCFWPATKKICTAILDADLRPTTHSHPGSETRGTHSPPDRDTPGPPTNERGPASRRDVGPAGLQSRHERAPARIDGRGHTRLCPYRALVTP